MHAYEICMVSYARKLISEHGVSEFGHMACPNSDFFFFSFLFFLFFFFFARVADEFSEVARDARDTRILHWRDQGGELLSLRYDLTVCLFECCSDPQKYFYHTTGSYKAFRKKLSTKGCNRELSS